MATAQRAKRELTRARVARDDALQSIRRLYALLQDAANDSKRQALFLARYNIMDRTINTFNAEQNNVMTALVELDRVHEFSETDRSISDEMEELYGEIEVGYSKFQKTIDVRNDRVDVGERETVFSTRALTLPKVELPKFDGNAVQWCSFRDTFISLVHENKSISEIKRFHYLISCLSGTALNIVKSVPLTADNYLIAWTALKNRFDNQRQLVTAHVDKLFVFERLQRESISSLGSFVNTFRENVAAVKALGVNDLADFLLFYLGARVVDPGTRRLFESSLAPNIIPTLDALLEFAAQRCVILENSESGQSLEPVMSSGPKRNKGDRPSVKRSFTVNTSIRAGKCKFCELDHPIFRCFAFKEKPVAQRREFVVSKRLCFICMRADHIASACQSAYLCKSCNGRHNTLLHAEFKGTASSSQAKAEQSSSTDLNTEKDATSPQFSGSVQSDTKVVLATAMIRIQNHRGEYTTIRALLDSGSQISAVTMECAVRLGMPQHKSRIEVVGLAQQPVTAVKGSTSYSFVPLRYDEPKFSAENVIILSKITSSLPHKRLPGRVREQYGHLQLADPDFDNPSPVDMLVGGDLYPLVSQSRADIIHSEGLPSALYTQLGWVVLGALKGTPMTSRMSLQLRTEPAIDSLMRQFWTVEEPHESIQATTEDEKCEAWFKRTVSRDTTGRFSVALPFKSVLSDMEDTSRLNKSARAEGLGTSRSLAINRLYNLERRLNKDPELYTTYRAFINDYIALGHMELTARAGEYYIPHHAVVKQSEKGIKIRVVFDASAPSSSGMSLHDCLATGPKLQADIDDVLLRNRFRKYIFIADIAKMYRQIQICERDHVYQHILWRHSPDEEVWEYELCTVTYGVSAAPFLAIRCLRLLDYENGPSFPLARQLLITNTYVDDIIAGADSIKDILNVERQIIVLLKEGCFELKKWASNCAEVLENVAHEDLATDPCFEPNEGQLVRVLDVYWEPQRDVFGYRSTPVRERPTKRSILSTVASLYDPIGVLGPAIFWAKCIMQETWCQKLAWDASVAPETSDRWNGFVSELSALDNILLPRHININRFKEIQLIGFLDASQKRYAATVYLRVLDEQSVAKVYFIICKTKVAPLKSARVDASLTIPRLELCAAVLLARLLAHRLAIIQEVIPISRVRAFVDSTIVLAWLRAEQKDFKVFVTNRIFQIKRLLPNCEWAHVGTTDNPAD